MLPILRSTLRNHVRVRLEEQRLSQPISLPHRPHVRPPRCHLLCADLEARPLQVLRHEPGRPLLVAVRFLRTIDTWDTDQLLRQAHELLAVDAVPDYPEQLPEAGIRPALRLCHAAPGQTHEGTVPVIGLKPVRNCCTSRGYVFLSAPISLALV